MKFTTALIASALFAGVQLAAAAPAPLRRQIVGKADPTAEIALKGIAIKTDDNRCFTVDKDAVQKVSDAVLQDVPSARFFENRETFEQRTPITLAKCDGSDGQKFDVVTKGKNNDRDNAALFVSQVTNTCLTADRRHALGSRNETQSADFDEVFFAPCGGKDNGVLLSQLYNTIIDATTGGSKLVAPTVANKAFCIAPIVEEGDLSLAIKDNRIDFTGTPVNQPLKGETFTLVQ